MEGASVVLGGYKQRVLQLAFAARRFGVHRNLRCGLIACHALGAELKSGREILKRKRSEKGAGLKISKFE